jgi:hypothetical protein
VPKWSAAFGPDTPPWSKTPCVRGLFYLRIGLRPTRDPRLAPRQSRLGEHPRLLAVLIQDLLAVQQFYHPSCRELAEWDLYALACRGFDRLVAAETQRVLAAWTPATATDFGDEVLGLYAALRQFQAVGLAHYQPAAALQAASYYRWFEAPLSVRWAPPLALFPQSLIWLVDGSVGPGRCGWQGVRSKVPSGSSGR